MRRDPRVWRWDGWATTRTCNTRVTHCRGGAGTDRRHRSPGSPSCKQTDSVAHGNNALVDGRPTRWRHCMMPHFMLVLIISAYPCIEHTAPSNQPYKFDKIPIYARFSTSKRFPKISDQPIQNHKNVVLQFCSIKKHVLTGKSI